MPLQDYRRQTSAPGPANAPRMSISQAADDSGAQAIGRGLGQVAQVLERAKQSREISEARVEITEGVGAINADLTQDQDHATMRPRYGERLDALRDRALERVTTPNLKSQVAEEFSRARVSTEARVFRREQEVAGGAARAALSRQLRAAANTIPTSTPEQAEEAFNSSQQTIDEMVAAGHLTPEQAQQERDRLDRDVSTGLVLGAINRDPAMAATELSRPGAYGLDETDRQRYLSTAQSAAEQDERARTSRLETRVERTRRLLETGTTVDPEDLAVLRAEAEGTAFAPMLEGSIAAREQLGNFASATPEQQRAFIDNLDRQGVSIDDAQVDQAFRRSLGAIHENTVRALETDPMAYAMQTGIADGDSIDLGSADSIAARMAAADELAGEYGAEWRVFTDAEADHYSTMLNDGQPNDQLAVVASIMDGFGERADRAFAELGGLNPVVRRAGELVMETGSDRTARTILSGLRAVDAGDELRVPAADAREVVMDEMSGAMADVPGGRETMIQAAEAYYAAKAQGRVRASDINGQVELLREGVQAAMGGVTHNGRSYGGIGEIGGVRVKLPSSMTQRRTETVLRDATSAQWSAASLSGGLPTEGLGDDAEEVVPNGDLVLQWSGRGNTYRLGVNGRRGVEWFGDPAASDGYFYLDLSDLDAAQRREGPAAPVRRRPAQAGSDQARPIQ